MRPKLPAQGLIKLSTHLPQVEMKPVPSGNSVTLGTAFSVCDAVWLKKIQIVVMGCKRCRKRTIHFETAPFNDGFSNGI